MTLTLEDFRLTFGLHPWTFWQWTPPNVHKAACNPVIFEEGWQNADAVSRSEILAALERAEVIFHQAAHYWPYRRQLEDVMAWPGWPGRRVSTRGKLIELSTTEAPALQIGVEVFELLGVTPVAVKDTDNDGYPNFFEATYATTVAPSELELYITEADRLGAPVGRRYQIKATAAAAGSDVRFRGGPWQLAKPELIGLATPDGLNPADDCNVVQQLEVWRRHVVTDGTTVDTAGIVFEYESHPCSCGCVAVTDPASVAQSLGRGLVENAEFGRVAVAEATWDGATWAPVCCGCSVPDRLRLRYIVGPLDQPGVDTVVLRMAAAELSRPMCMCGNEQVGSAALAHWQNDMARVVSGGVRWMIPMERLSNPIGTRRGHVAAWEWITANALKRAVA